MENSQRRRMVLAVRVSRWWVHNAAVRPVASASLSDVDLR